MRKSGHEHLRGSLVIPLFDAEGQLTIASTGKDAQTGRLVTHEYHVEGPVMIFLTTTAIEMDEELLNRCVVLSVDEGREQTRAIHELQRERQTLEGLFVIRDSRRIRKVHQDAQRLLRPLLVANPFARELTFLFRETLEFCLDVPENTVAMGLEQLGLTESQASWAATGIMTVATGGANLLKSGAKKAAKHGATQATQLAARKNVKKNFRETAKSALKGGCFIAGTAVLLGAASL